MQGVFRRSLVRNPVLFGEPRTHVHEPAAITAEGPVLRALRPFHVAPAGGTFDYRGHNRCAFRIHAQQVRRNGTSTSTCTGRAVTSSQFKKRIVQRC